MRRLALHLGLVVAATLSALFAWHSSSGAPQRPDNGAVVGERQINPTLPLSHIVLFTSGVGYFQREGEVAGNARVDLQFPASDVNDLLKSLVLQDSGPGKVTAVSYDGQEPSERTLKTFSIDLTGNPTFGQLLNQARGEKIEVTMQNGSGVAAGTLTGTIVGMESQQEPGPREVHQLNLLCAEGMRGIPLNTVQRVRFLNAALDAELHRALEVLAGAHNSQKKSVTVQFDGEGKRNVKVGYVVEAPMWKSSYRLVFDKAGKATLQGWAIVENTTDEDWKDVRMALVSSRPISFQMDLYPPLFVPRPVVEPERFASLRPPEYEGPLTNNQGQLGGGMGLGGVGGIGGIAGLGGGGFNQLGAQGGGQGNFQGKGNLGAGGMIGFGGQQLGIQGGGFNRYQPYQNPLIDKTGINRLTYQQLQERRKEREAEREQSKQTARGIDWNNEFDPTTGIDAAALTETVGDQVRYVVDHKISLARQRSMLLPLLNEEVTGQRVSIFNEKVHGKFPLRGMRIKNTTKQSLMQGPVAVYEGGSYSGDARLPDLQAGEERLLSFAVDQAVEVKAEKGGGGGLTLVRVVKGVVEETYRKRSSVLYHIKNRGSQERTLIVEQLINRDWKLVDTEKPTERSRDFYLFEWKVPAGQAFERAVIEEQTHRKQYELLNTDTSGIHVVAGYSMISPKLREAMQKALEYKGRISDTKRELTRLRSQFSEVTEEQNRVRTSLEKVPANTPLHKRYLEKLDKLETDIETLQGKIKETQAKEKKQEADFANYVSQLTLE